MIYGSVQSFQDDARIIGDWVRGKPLSGIQSEDQTHRVQVAAARMLTTTAMAFAGLWALSILTFVVTLPLKIAFNLATSVFLVVVSYDLLRMSHNAARPNFRQNGHNFWDNLKGHGMGEEARALEFTHGTLLQAGWMKAYMNRNILSVT